MAHRSARSSTADMPVVFPHGITTAHGQSGAPSLADSCLEPADVVPCGTVHHAETHSDDLSETSAGGLDVRSTAPTLRADFTDLKLYVYDLPEAFNVHLYAACWSWFKFPSFLDNSLGLGWLIDCLLHLS